MESSERGTYQVESKIAQGQRAQPKRYPDVRKFRGTNPLFFNPPIAAPGTKNILDYCFSSKTEGDITGHYRKETSGPILKSSSPSIRNRKFWARQIRKNPQIKVQSPVKSKRHRIEDENPELTDVERKAKVQKSHSANGE
ncbi:hypothetical protein U1Q18_002547, partial [Sarracenia purpurea var. burkii]